MQATTKYFFLAGSNRIIQVRTPHLIKWVVPTEPYITLNTDGSSIGNLGMVGAGGLLRDSSGFWISRFSLNLGIATNNVAELAAVR